MSDADRENLSKRLGRPSWGETKFFLIACLILGGVALGGVWTRIEEFEAGEFKAGAIVMSIVVGIILAGLVAAIRVFLGRLLRDEWR